MRPEDVEVSLERREGWSAARVYVVEAMGSESFTRLQSDSRQITARVPPDLPLDFDQIVWFRPRPEKLRYFDTRTGEATPGARV